MSYLTPGRDQCHTLLSYPGQLQSPIEAGFSNRALLWALSTISGVKHSGQLGVFLSAVCPGLLPGVVHVNEMVLEKGGTQSNGVL